MNPLEGKPGEDLLLGFLKTYNLVGWWSIIPVSNISLGTPEKDISKNEFNSGF